MAFSLHAQLRKTRAGGVALARKSNAERKNIVRDIAEAILKAREEILRANKKDLSRMNPKSPLHDRLRLDPARLRAIVKDAGKVARLPDPLGKITWRHRIRPGLLVERQTVPIGVVGVIYESRPNVTVDIAALCLRSGNAAVLRGGSEADASNRAFVRVMQAVLKRHSLPPDCVTLLPSDRTYTRALLTAEGFVDMVIPRGSASLIAMVRRLARVPVIETGAGIVHTYIHSDADVDMAVRIIVNAKVSRPSVCNALDTVLIHRNRVQDVLPKLARALAPHRVEMYADTPSYTILAKEYPHELLKKARERDFGREFLSLKMSVKVVSSLEEALHHIARYSSRHSEAIVTKSQKAAEVFLREADSANVMWNASTRFSDGGEYGLGAEVGISTQKLHARGPMGVEALTTYKWVVRGKGHIR